MNARRGFTLIELIVTMMIIGIMGVVTMSRFSDRSMFEGRGFLDETQALLRYGQKAAIAQHRTVCVRFTANQAWLTIRSAAGDAACGAQAAPNAVLPANEVALTGPNGAVPFTVTAGTTSGYGPVPATFRFDAVGRPQPNNNQVITVTGGGTVTVEAETGHVR